MSSALRFAMAGIYLFDGIYHCIRVFTAKDTDNSIVPDVLECGINLVTFGLSMGSGYGCYSPMGYNSDWPTARFNCLWFFNVAFSATTSLVSVATIKLKGDDSLSKVLNACAIFGGAVSLVLEIAAVCLARKLDLSPNSIEYQGVAYPLKPDVLQQDRNVFTAEVIGFCLNDIGGMIDSVLGFLSPSKAPTQVKIAICAGRGIVGLGSTSAHIVCFGLMV